MRCRLERSPELLELWIFTSRVCVCVFFGVVGVLSARELRGMVLCLADHLLLLSVNRRARTPPPPKSSPRHFVDVFLQTCLCSPMIVFIFVLPVFVPERPCG